MFALLYLWAMLVSLAILRTLSVRSIFAGMVFCGMLFGFIGFCMTPRPGLYIDIVRFFETLDMARLHSDGLLSAWFYLLDSYGYSSTPVIGFILAVCSRFSENGWITFIAAMGDVCAGLWLVWRTSQRCGSKRVMMFGAAFFFMVFNFNAAVSGVRMNLACSWACCIAYRSLVEGKREAKGLVGYLALALIHPFSLVIAAFDVTYRLIGTKRFPMVAVHVLLLGQGFWQTALFGLFDLLSFIPFFDSLAFKTTQYFGETAYIGASSNLNRIRSVLLFAAMAFFAIRLLARSKQIIPSGYKSLCTMHMCLTLGAFQDEALFSRCVSTMLFVVLPVMACAAYRVPGERHQSARPSPAALQLLIVFFQAVCLVDNLRAGVRFLVIDFSVTGLILLVAAPVAAILADYVSRGSNGARRAPLFSRMPIAGH